MNLVFGTSYFVAFLSCNWFSFVNSTSEGKIWVVCVSGFNYYRFTYAFEGGIYRICDLIGGPGYQNKIIISPDDVAFNVNNVVPGHIKQDQMESDDEPNYYEDVEITYNAKSMTDKLFYDILSGKKNGNNKVLDSGPEDTVIIVFITLGEHGLIHLTNDVTLKAEELVTFLEDLSDKGRFKRLLFILESPFSGSLFDGYLDPNKNILAWTNSPKNGKLTWCDKDFSLLAYTTTCHSFFFSKNLEQLINEGNYEGITLGDFYQLVRKSMYSSQPNLYGQLEWTNLGLSEFFGSPLKPRYKPPVKPPQPPQNEKTKRQKRKLGTKKAFEFSNIKKLQKLIKHN